MRLFCGTCGLSVSNEVPKDTIVRAWIECPECIEKQPDYVALLSKKDAEIACLKKQIDRHKEDAESRAAEIERLKIRNKNLMESLRGIANMKPHEGERMIQWAKDSLSGFTEPVESTVKKQQDEIAALKERIKELEGKIAEFIYVESHGEDKQAIGGKDAAM